MTMPVRVYDGFDQLPEAYRQLFRAAGRRNYFLSHEWFRNLAATALDPGTRIRLYAVERGDEGGTPLALLIAASPAGRDGSIFEGKRIGPQTLSGMTNYQSIDFAPLISSEVTDPSGPLRELIAFLGAERPRWSLIDFNLLDPEAPWFEPLAEQLGAAGLVVRPADPLRNILPRARTMSAKASGGISGSSKKSTGFAWRSSPLRS